MTVPVLAPASNDWDGRASLLCHEDYAKRKSMTHDESEWWLKPRVALKASAVE